MDDQIPLKAVPVLRSLALMHGASSFSDIRTRTGLPQATLNRILNQLCKYRYAIKVGHGQYEAGPELVEMGLELTRNQAVPRFKCVLSSLKQETRLNAELYVITPAGPVFLTHSPAKGEATVPFRFGRLIRNRDSHPAALFYLAIHEDESPEGSENNFIVDRGRQWPELFRAAAMVPGSSYCIAVSGMLSNVNESELGAVKNRLHSACVEAGKLSIIGGNRNGKLEDDAGSTKLRSLK